MYNAKSLLLLHAITPLHPGSGSALGAIDLPVQRERHTNWPVVPASSLKGVLRAEMSNNERVPDIFGPDTDKAADHAGALALTDARILFFPVRSMKGVFALATCPAVLNRLRRDLNMAGVEQKIPEFTVQENQGLFSENATLLHNNKAVLEDVEITSGGGGNLAELAKLLELPAELKNRVVLVSDDTFTHFVTYCTEVTTRIKIDSGTKTVVEGALFNQELLPPECFFYSVALMADSRKKGEQANAKVLMDELSKKFHGNYIQIGADETTGKGFCRLTFVDGGK